jgi:ABC-type sulfate/molybdate transport systems ATPase subunit
MKTFSDKVVVLVDGAIAQQGTVNEILNHPTQILTERFWGNSHA